MLRIILILMVCTLHACGRFDAIFAEGAAPDAARYAGMVLESLSVVAVNTWVIMSGYLLLEKEFRLPRLFELLATVIFYAALGFLIVLLLAKTNATFSIVFSEEISRILSGGIFSAVQALFPISAEYYWFMTCYLLLYILTPVINKGARSLTKKQYRVMLVLLLIWNSLIKSFVPVNFVIDNGGYDLKWFICLYLIGAYFRLEEIGFGLIPSPKVDNRTATGDVAPDQAECTSNKVKIRKATAAWAVYFCSVFMIYLISLIFYRANLSNGSFAYYMTVPLHYNYVLTLSGACGLFLGFKKMKVKRGVFLNSVSRLAPHTLGVYLLHAHPLLFYTWTALTVHLTGSVPRNHAALFILYVFANIIVLFVCGIIVDFLRSQCFLAAKKLFKK